MSQHTHIHRYSLTEVPEADLLAVVVTGAAEHVVVGSA